MGNSELNFFDQILYKLTEANMETPTFLSSFHIVAFLLVLCATVGVGIWFGLKAPKEQYLRLFVLCCWIVMVLFETYKQLSFAFSYSEELGVVWNYDWHSFPFQLCSSPLYVLPFVVFLKEGKVRDAFLAYICTFSFFGGLVVMIYPGTVFIPEIMINIQTMVHHGLQVLVGIALIVYYRKKFTWSFLIGALIVFAGLLAIAQLLNWIVPNFTEDKFTMFSLSWIHGCELPILSTIYEKAHYLVFFLAYAVGFVMVALIIFSIIKLALFLSKKCKAAIAKKVQDNNA